MPPVHENRSFDYQASPAARDWDILDMRGETQYLQDYNTTKQMTAAFETMNPDQSSKKQHNTEMYIASTLKARPGSGYSGPHISWPLVADEVDNLVTHFATKPNIPLHECYMCRILVEARNMFAKMPPLTRVATKTEQHVKLVVVGDLHGQLSDLLTIFIENGFPSPQGTQYVFNGDFVDRGDFGAEVATILMAYKLLFPNTVHLNRGNHETVNMNITYGFIDEVNDKFGSVHMFSLFAQVWDNLPVATVIDDAVLVLHGGLFRTNGITLNHLNSLPKKDNDLSSTAPDMLLLTDLLWSDPQETPGRQPGVRGSGTIQFGPDITQQFLRQNHLRLLIRSHQVPSTNRGYEVMHNGMCITVFSASNYCGSQGNHGGLVIFDKPGQHRCTEFWAPPLEVLAQEMSRRSLRRASMVRRVSAEPCRTESDIRARQAVLNQLKDLITKRYSDLSWFFKGCQQDSLGRISIDDWRSGLMAVLQLSIDLAPHEAELLKGQTGPLIEWKSFLSHYKVAVAEKFGGWQDEMKKDIYSRLNRADLTMGDYYRLFDQNGDGQIDVDELQRGLSEGLGLELTRDQAQEMLIAMAGPGGKLDVLTFLESLQMEYTGKDQSPEVQEVIAAIEKTLKTSSKNMLEVFRQLDRNSDGMLSQAEIQQFLEWLARAYPEYSRMAQPGRAEKVMRAFDVDHSGSVSLLEFLKNFKPSHKGYDRHIESLVQKVARALYDHKSSLKALFYRIDTDGNGCLSSEEFLEGLRTLSTLDDSLTSEDLALVAKHVDSNEDGQISWPEFLSAFGLDAETRQRMSSHPPPSAVPTEKYPSPPKTSPSGGSSQWTVPSSGGSPGSSGPATVTPSYDRQYAQSYKVGQLGQNTSFSIPGTYTGGISSQSSGSAAPTTTQTVTQHGGFQTVTTTTTGPDGRRTTTTTTSRIV